MSTFTISSGDAGTAGSTPTPNAAPTAVVPSTLAPDVLDLTAVVVPLAAVPAQVLAVSLGTQPCRIDVYQKSTGLFLDLYVADRLVVAGALCRDRNVLVIDGYLAFAGDLAFYDTQGTSDPDWTGLGSRYQLVWLTQ